MAVASQSEPPTVSNAHFVLVQKKHPELLQCLRPPAGLRQGLAKLLQLSAASGSPLGLRSGIQRNIVGVARQVTQMYADERC